MNQIGLDILAKNQINLGMLGAAAEMARIWDKWVELPRLSVVGKIEAQGTDYHVDTKTGYQDHEGGRFDWGSVRAGTRASSSATRRARESRRR